MKKIPLGSVGASGISLIAGAAIAGDHHRDRFERLDADGDGAITAAEVSEQGAKLVADADADGDGAVTREEMRAHHQARRKARDADTNDDGVIDRTEFIKAAQDRFDRLDENGDGVLSEDEKPGRRQRHRPGRR